MRATLICILLLLAAAAAHPQDDKSEKKTPATQQRHDANSGNRTEEKKSAGDKNDNKSDEHQTGTQEASGEPTAVDISSGDLHMPGGAVLHVEHLRAVSVSRLSGQACKCKTSTIQIHSGQLSTTDADLTKLLNHGFEKKGEKKHIEVTAEGDKLKFEGTKASILPIHFDARPVAIGQGRIKLESSDIKAGPIPVEGLMHTFGMNMDDLMHPKNKAVTISKDNIIIDLEYVSKNPKLVGTVRSVAIQGHRIILTFGPQLQKAKETKPAPAQKKTSAKKPA